MRYYRPPPPPRPQIVGEDMSRDRQNTGFRPFLEELQREDKPVTREEFNALVEEFFKLSKTVEGMQQLFIKAGEYQGKPRGRLPR